VGKGGKGERPHAKVSAQEGEIMGWRGREKGALFTTAPPAPGGSQTSRKEEKRSIGAD